jgi:type VI secretion system secreted protein VgrG
VGGQLSREELVTCLQEALKLAQSLTSQAKSQQAGSADTAPQEALAKAAADWGHGANAEKGSNGGARIIAASAPDGIALTTPKDLTSFSGEHTDLVAQKNHQFSSGQHTHVHAGTGINLYANSGGISSIANQGKHLTQAQHDDVVINAEQSINLTASKQHILAAAEQHITLTAGGAYIKLQGGNIELGCPGSFIVKAGNYTLTGPANMKEELPKFVKGDVGRKVQLLDPASGTPIKDHPFSITKADGSVVKGVTDASGHTPLQQSAHYEVSGIEFLKKKP